VIIQPEIYALAEGVVKDIPKGRAADTGASLPALGEMVRLGGNGDHVEIGCLFGASAIMAALVKEHYHLSGTIYTIDPFEPRSVAYFDKVPEGTEEGSIDAVLENLDHFHVGHRVQVLKMSSYPWPAELDKHEFVTGFIDGNHVGLAPWFDFLSLRDRVKLFIGIDNFEESYPDVLAAGVRTLAVGGWILHYKSGIFMSIRKPIQMPEKEQFKSEKEYAMARSRVRDWSMI